MWPLPIVKHYRGKQYRVYYFIFNEELSVDELKCGILNMDAIIQEAMVPCELTFENFYIYGAN
jgi:hypothetical protein